MVGSSAKRPRESDFEYTSLTNTQTDIRLLKLEPGNGNSPLMGSLSTHTIADTKNDTNLKWNSLSYCWDNPIDDDKIPDINRDHSDSEKEDAVTEKEGTQGLTQRYIFLTAPTGKHRLPIHENLFEALLFLRNDSKICSSFLWVDAICINQSDLTERSIQVSLMSRLYHRATAVIVWLGHFRDTRRNELRAWVANITNDMASEGDWAETKMSHARVVRDGRWQSFTNEVHNYIKDPELRVFWEGWDLLLSANWFQRIWTFAEAVLSTQLIMCGPGFCFDMDRWFPLADKLHDHRFEYCIPLRSIGRIAMAGTHAIWRTPRMKRDRKDGTLDLYELMQVTETCKATDKRDLIYGLLTLENRDRDSETVQRPEVDYTKPVPEVFTEFASYWLSNQYEDVLMTFFAICSDPDFDPLIPSWVPNWSRQDRRRGLITIPARRLERLGCNGSCMYQGTKYPMRVKIPPGMKFRGKQLMALRGIKFDRIKIISKVTGKVIRKHKRNEWRDFYTDSEALAHPLARAGSKQHRLRRELWKVIIMERSLRIINLAKSWHNSPLKCGDSIYHVVIDMIDLDHMCLTERGYLGFCIESARPGDEIFYAYGTMMPMIIRKVERSLEAHVNDADSKNEDMPRDIYQIVDGTCYIHGMMNGGALQISEQEGIEAEDVWFC